MVTKMVQKLRVSDVMLEGIVNQPQINCGPFILCYEPVNEPKNVITYFYDDEWVRIAYSIESDENKFRMKQTTKEDCYLSGSISDVKALLLEEAKKLEAIVLFAPVKFPVQVGNGYVDMPEILKEIGIATTTFTARYLSYKKSAYYHAAKEAHKLKEGKL